MSIINKHIVILYKFGLVFSKSGNIAFDYTKRASTDQSLKGINKIAKEEGLDVAKKIADSIIKNTYKTLMTRGMKGCYVYCTDRKLEEYFKKNI